MPFFAAVDAPQSPESMKFPVNSLLAGNSAPETSSLETASSSSESATNRAAAREMGVEIRGNLEELVVPAIEQDGFVDAHAALPAL